MSIKKADMARTIAQKLAGRLKASGTPERYGRGSAIGAAKPDKTTTPPPAKSVAVSFRLPADLVSRLRERALAHEGGMGGVLTAAAEHWLSATDGSASKPTS